MQQRGSKYDARTKEQALALIASGVSITNAARQLQIPKSTVVDWWNTQGDADEDAIAARREARRASILKCGKIVDKALAALDKRVAAAGREARDMDEGLKVLKKAAKDGVIGLSEDEVKSLQKIVQDYTGIGLRELSGTVKDIAQQQLTLEQQLLDAPDAAPALHVQLTLVDPAGDGAPGSSRPTGMAVDGAPGSSRPTGTAGNSALGSSRPTGTAGDGAAGSDSG